MKNVWKAFLISMCLAFCFPVVVKCEDGNSDKYKAQKDVLDGVIRLGGYDGSDMYSEYFAGLYAENFDSVYQMEEYQTTDELSVFLFACVYFREILEVDTYGYMIGSEGLRALEALSNGYTEKFMGHMDRSLEYYNTALAESNVQTESASVIEPTTLGAGIFIVGEDIPAGKYDITAINGSGGTICFYPNYDIYKNDGKSDGYYFLYAEDYKYYSKGDSTTASNILLSDGNCIDIESGLELQFTPK